MIVDVVLLVSPPWRPPEEPCLALATLKPLLDGAGIAAEVVHGSLLYPPTEMDRLFMASYGGHLFAADGDVDAALDALTARFVDELNLRGIVVPGATRLAELGRDEAAMRSDVRAEMARARACIDRCLEVAARPRHDIVGLSVTFESQLPAAVALARRLKARRPEVAVVLGGAACLGAPADAMIRAFPEIDVVCHGEGEQVIVPLIHALRARAAGGVDSLAGVPGISWRAPGGAVRRNPAPPLVRDLDTLPMPDYDDFLAAHAESEWRHVAPKLFFETSRGCWWGEKTLCSFCGLNGEGLAFRRKTVARAHEEIHHLYTRYPTARRLQATDNIMAVEYLDALLPRLATLPREPDRPLRIFFELKSNLRKAHHRALVDAGVDLVQPGIESFSDEVLALMRKGNTALGQLQFLKWAVEAGLAVTYNLLVRNPGEEAAWYRRMLELIPSIDHLPPPDCVTPVWIERFSPYHMRPAEHGLRDLRARPHYRAIWGALPVPLEDLAYVFDYDHDMLRDAELFDAVRDLALRVGRWQTDWRPDQLTYRDDGAALHILDRRAPDAAPCTLTGPGAEVFRFLDRIRTVDAVARRFPNVQVEAILDDLLARRWICRDTRDRHLAVVPAARS